MKFLGKFITAAIVVCCIGFISQPAMAQQGYDQGAAAKIVSNTINQGFGIVLDPLGQFCRGMEASGPILEKHPVLKFPLFAIPVGVYKGITYAVSVPEQYAARLASIGGFGQPVGLWETSDWALWAANNPWYTGAKLGALGGGLTVVFSGGMWGLTYIETATLLTATGAIGGAAVNTGVDWTLKANW